MKTARFACSSRHRERGLTLIELMVVVVIVGLLAALAYSAYGAQVQQARRSDGKGMLVTLAQQLERCYTRYHSYNNGNCAVHVDIADGGILSTEGWYLITNDNAGANTFRLVATPQGGQTDDTRCANLRLTHTGARDATGTDTARCW